MAEAQTINNQLKAAMVMATEAATMTATRMRMEIKRGWRWRRKGSNSARAAASLVAAAAAWQEHGVSSCGQLGDGGGSLASVQR